MKITKEVNQRNVELALIAMWMLGFENARQGGVPENFPKMNKVNRLLNYVSNQSPKLHPLR